MTTEATADQPPKVTGSPDEIWLVYNHKEADTHQNCVLRGDVCWEEQPQCHSDVRYVRADLVEGWRLKAAQWLRTRQDSLLTKTGGSRAEFPPEWLANEIEAAPATYGADPWLSTR